MMSPFFVRTSVGTSTSCELTVKVEICPEGGATAAAEAEAGELWATAQEGVSQKGRQASGSTRSGNGHRRRDTGPGMEAVYAGRELQRDRKAWVDGERLQPFAAVNRHSLQK